MYTVSIDFTVLLNIKCETNTMHWTEMRTQDTDKPHSSISYTRTCPRCMAFFTKQLVCEWEDTWRKLSKYMFTVFLLDKWQLRRVSFAILQQKVKYKLLKKNEWRFYGMVLDNENIIEHMQVHTPIWSSGLWLQGIKQTFKLVEKKKSHKKPYSNNFSLKYMLRPCHQLHVKGTEPFPD